jgi:hypothetical protein
MESRGEIRGGGKAMLGVGWGGGEKHVKGISSYRYHV